MGCMVRTKVHGYDNQKRLMPPTDCCRISAYSWQSIYEDYNNTILPPNILREKANVPADVITPNDARQDDSAYTVFQSDSLDGIIVAEEQHSPPIVYKAICSTHWLLYRGSLFNKSCRWTTLIARTMLPSDYFAVSLKRFWEKDGKLEEEVEDDFIAKHLQLWDKYENAKQAHACAECTNGKHDPSASYSSIDSSIGDTLAASSSSKDPGADGLD
ncbi:hypothetical protein O0I10_011593 [Lichtheimia ornata]|uniref:Uncharacterized protein n=1 Tax=Lichtheimia ornata TaxID=688661 RepID=A0AAD7UUB6_9FUNG|nr:uncharacterized protein O0I10_011593 [Lichtheimia ornata]KAJ8652787.1 hypothetical protein O0I10_011593 [Lichtheimia ornata]